MRFPNYKQDDARDCGAACLQMVCSHFGKYIDLERLRLLTNTSREGTSVASLIRVGSELGLRCTPYSVSYFKFRHEVPLPCIVLWKGNHFAVVYKITEKHIYVSDPSVGLIRYNLTEFANGWLSPVSGSKTKRGICITIEKTPAFDDVKPDPQKNKVADAIVWFWNYIKPEKMQVIKIIIAAAALTTLGVVFPFITQTIVDTGIPNRDYSLITVLLSSMIALTVGQTVGNWIQANMTLRVAVKTRVTMTSDYIARLFRMPLLWFDNRLTGDIFQRNADFDRIESGSTTAVFAGILSVFSLTIFGAVLLIYSAPLFWVFVIGATLYMAWVLVFWEIRKRMDIRYFSLLAKNNSQWIEFVTRITDIKLFRNGDARRWNWERNQVELYRTRMKLLYAEQAQALGSSFIKALKDAALIWLSAKSVISGEMTLGMLTAVQYLLGQMGAPLDGTVNFIISLQLSTISYNRVTDTFRSQTEKDEPTVNDVLLPACGDLALNGVSFRYGADKWAIDRVDLVFPAGKTSVIVGQSGSGKSTLLKILAGLYEPTLGNVAIGGMPLYTVSINAWRERCGVITQDCGLVRGTIYDNIVFGREPNKDALIRSVSLASIREEIETMSRGYETLIGENGRGVSEGQKQRILLARALYSDPDYLLLDEMTSSLDNENEKAIVTMLRESLPGKTIIIVSHKRESAESADLVVVMENGTVVEAGTPAVLANLGNAFRRFFPPITSDTRPNTLK